MLLNYFEKASAIECVVNLFVLQWALVCDGEWKVHIAKFSLLVGSICGYLLMGAMADWYVRDTHSRLWCCAGSLTVFFVSGWAVSRCCWCLFCLCWCSVWPWPSLWIWPCSARCASSKASVWRRSDSRFTSSVSLTLFPPLFSAVWGCNDLCSSWIYTSPSCNHISQKDVYIFYRCLHIQFDLTYIYLLHC